MWITFAFGSVYCSMQKLLVVFLGTHVLVPTVRLNFMTESEAGFLPSLAVSCA